MERLFGTDGVRGVANADLTPELVFRLGRAGAHHLMETAGAGDRPRLVVGKDTRLSSDVLEAALAAGAASAGADVVRLGVVTTPAVAYLTRRLGAAGGAMISASHNPAEYNGIKFFSADGYKFPDTVEDTIQALVLSVEDRLPRPTGGGLGRIQAAVEAAEAYLDALAATVSDGAATDSDGAANVSQGRRDAGAAGGAVAGGGAAPPFRGLKVVVDCAHGAAYRLAPELLRRLGAAVAVFNDRPDGLNINAACGSLHPEGLRAAVIREGAHAGLAFDGDADRVIALDEKGELVDGDQILAIAGLHLLRAGRLPGGAVVATVMSNLGLEQALERAGARLVRTRVGDRYVLEAMREGGYALGGEQSGHVIFLEHATTGDGLLTAVQVLRIMVETGRPLSELAGQMARYPQLLVNVEARRRDGWADNRRVREAMRVAESALRGRGRVLVRPSGTEPLIRVMVEGEDADTVRTLAEDLAGVLRQELN